MLPLVERQKEGIREKHVGKYKYKYIFVNDPAFGLGNGLSPINESTFYCALF